MSEVTSRWPTALNAVVARLQFNVRRSSGVLEILLGTALSAPLGFATQILIARTTSLEAFGVFAVMMAAVNIAQVPATLDFGAAILRYASRYSVQQRPGMAGAIIRRGRLIAFAGSTLMFGAIVLWQSERFLALGSVELLLFFGVFLLASLTRVDQMAAIAVDRRRSVLFGYQVVRPAIAATILLIAWKGIGIDRSAGVALPLAAAMIGLLVAELWLIGSIRTAVRSGTESKRERTVWLRYAVAMMSLTLASVVVASQSDLVLVALLAGAKDAGVYAASNQLATIVPLLGGAIATFQTREISAAHDTGRREDLIVACKRLEKLLMLISIAGCALVIGFGPIVLGLFGKDFTGGMPILIVLSLAHAVSLVFSTVPSLVMSLRGEQRSVLTVILVSGAVSVLVSVIAATRVGALGVAFGTLSGMIARTIILRLRWATSGAATK